MADENGLNREPGDIDSKKYSKEELEEAKRSIISTISKCEKVIPKLKEGSAQQTLLTRRIKAFRIATELLDSAMEELNSQ